MGIAFKHFGKLEEPHPFGEVTINVGLGKSVAIIGDFNAATIDITDMAVVRRRLGFTDLLFGFVVFNVTVMRRARRTRFLRLFAARCLAFLQVYRSPAME
ncbi:hypothetical protein [Sphingorhabdus sp.]|uniref:hypothetical protein n=1 Tax=Sphingorhabdus sp. TaxID=1902408 RepID=UPI003D814C7C